MFIAKENNSLVFYFVFFCLFVFSSFKRLPLFSVLPSFSSSLLFPGLQKVSVISKLIHQWISIFFFYILTLYFQWILRTLELVCFQDGATILVKSVRGNHLKSTRVLLFGWSTSPSLPLLTLISTLRDRYCYISRFTNEETEADAIHYKVCGLKEALWYHPHMAAFLISEGLSAFQH